MEIVVFEDSHVQNLAPVTHTRPAMAIACGGYRLIDLLVPLGERHGATLRAVVRPHLRQIVAMDYPVSTDDAAATKGPRWYVNARLVPSARNINALEKLFRNESDGVVDVDGVVAAAKDSAGVVLGPFDEDRTLSNALATCDLPKLDENLPLLNFPHEIVAQHTETIGENVEHRLACGEYLETQDGVFLAASLDGQTATIADTAAFVTTGGPVVIEVGASVAPHTVVYGPCHIGERASVVPGALLKGKVALGHTSKAGGEIDSTIFEPYSNKQHEGVLGYSYLGSWINIGAGTNQSDLKNTYGTIRVTYGDEKVETGMQFFGTVMGDYAKTAINTGIFTGKIIGTASTLYGMVTENVPSFVNYARSMGQQGELPAEVAVTTQQRMFARRAVKQRECDKQLLRDVFAMTAAERKGLSPSPLSF
ncbi:MAG: glucose-1-phosphate thymidylyltransferase [Pirellulales bacterium]|nr:glucose-1-phosphate thymidylyltransferase [Pirellulales bacterium]